MSHSMPMLKQDNSDSEQHQEGLGKYAAGHVE